MSRRPDNRAVGERVEPVALDIVPSCCGHCGAGRRMLRWEPETTASPLAGDVFCIICGWRLSLTRAEAERLVPKRDCSGG